MCENAFDILLGALHQEGAGLKEERTYVQAVSEPGMGHPGALRR